MKRQLCNMVNIDPNLDLDNINNMEILAIFNVGGSFIARHQLVIILNGNNVEIYPYLNPLLIL